MKFLWMMKMSFRVSIASFGACVYNQAIGIHAHATTIEWKPYRGLFSIDILCIELKSISIRNKNRNLNQVNLHLGSKAR